MPKALQSSLHSEEGRRHGNSAPQLRNLLQGVSVMDTETIELFNLLLNGK